MTSLVVLNSILVGAMLVALCIAVSVLACVVDQQVGLSAVPDITQWAFDYRPTDLRSMISLAVAATATCLFAGLALRRHTETLAASSLSSAVIVLIALVAATYFFSFVAAALISQIHVDGHLYSASSPPTHRHIYPQHLHPPAIDSRIWILAVVIYSLGLLIVGIRLHRRREAINPV
jgi:hypothetical protein